MSKKRSSNLEEALQKILEPGTDSEIEELKESDTEDDTSNNTVTTLPKIGDDLEQPDPSDLLATENYVENEKTVGQVDGENIIDDAERECNNDSIDLSKYLKHVPRWHGKMTPPACDIHFLGDEFSLPPDDLNTWTSLNYFKLFWKYELHELLPEQTNLYSFQKKPKSINSSPGKIEQFIGIHMFIFIIILPAFYMNWASETRYPPVTVVMSIARYKALHENLHVSDNTKCNDPENKDNKLYKIQPVLDHV